MRILITGAGRSLGEYMYSRLVEARHEPFGVGPAGPDYQEDFLNLHRQPYKSAQLIFDAAEKALGGPVQCLINNAAITRIEFLESHPVQDFVDVLQANLIMPFVLTREACRRRGQTGDLRIINISSSGVKTGLRASCGYVAAKAGLEAFSKTIAKEYAGRNGGRARVLSFAIRPPSIEGTAMREQAIEELMRTRGWDRKRAEDYSVQSPLGRPAEMSEVMACVNWCLTAPEYCTGMVMDMPGGTGL